MTGRGVRLIPLVLLLGACASGPPEVPFPAFIQTDELPSVFLANLPGVTAKRLVGNPRSGRSSNRVVLPPDWSFSATPSPGMTLEIFVLRGEIELGELTLRPGGYAYLPSPRYSSTMRSRPGAEILYFVNEASKNAVIQTPLFVSSEDLDWAPLSSDVEDIGLMVKPLRRDPGSGASTWLLKVAPGATRRWRKASVTQEGFLIAGSDRISECVDGEAATGDYFIGGYYIRPPGALSGGPESISATGATWFLREASASNVQAVDACTASVVSY